jgi:hypothetical protein
VSLNLPAPIDQAKLNERVQAWADAIVASHDGQHPDLPVLHVKGADVPLPAPFIIEVDRLVKWWKVVQVAYGQRSVHAFLDPATGDVYKAAGWKAPAKGARYNLLDDASYTTMLARLALPGGWAGGYLYAR